MSKANHTVTVPREYLEELERFKEENTTENNAKLSIKNVGLAKGLFLESNFIPAHIFREIDGLYIINKEGQELGFFHNTKRF